LTQSPSPPRPRAPRTDTTHKEVGTSTWPPTGTSNWPSVGTYSWPQMGTFTWPRTASRLYHFLSHGTTSHRSAIEPAWSARRIHIPLAVVLAVDTGSRSEPTRPLLADNREQVADDLARSRTRLRECVEGDQVVGLRAMARMRFEVRELEANKRELDRLIAALDRRFSARWSRQG